MKFTQVLDKTRDVEIYGLADGVEVESVRLTVEWELYLETRDWGVKDFSASVTNVYGEYTTFVTDAKWDAPVEETIEFDFTPFKENAKFVTKLTEHNQLMVSHLEIDLGTNSLEVS